MECTFSYLCKSPTDSYTISSLGILKTKVLKTTLSLQIRTKHAHHIINDGRFDLMGSLFITTNIKRELGE